MHRAGFLSKRLSEKDLLIVGLPYHKPESPGLIQKLLYQLDDEFGLLSRDGIKVKFAAVASRISFHD